MDTIVRLLAVENYYHKNDYGWRLYSKMQNLRKGNGYAEEAIKRFEKLIVSWEKSGYDKTSSITVNKNMKLLDGSHRLALALYYNLDEISVRIQDKADEPEYDLMWFIENGFAYDDLDKIQKRYETLIEQGWGKNRICCVLWAPVAEYFDEITEKISMLYPVKVVKNVDFSDETYNRMVKAIYNIDDIPAWKIDKKIEYMKNFYPKKMRYLSLDFDMPMYRFKQGNFHTILTQGENLKRIIRNCYKDKISDYFYDICIHTSDNTMQAAYIDKLFNFKLDLSKYFLEIQKYNYMIIKFESENMPKDFPQSFPFSKDIDIVCSKDDFDNLVRFTNDFFLKDNSAGFEIRLVNDGQYSKRVRIELDDFLIFQIDVRAVIGGIKDIFIEDSLKRKNFKNGFFLPLLEDELLYRAVEYLEKPEKTHHFDFIKTHLYDADLQDWKNNTNICLENLIEKLKGD